MRTSRREVAGLTGAIVAHAAVLALVMLGARAPAAPSSAPAGPPPLEIDVAVETQPNQAPFETAATSGDSTPTPALRGRPAAAGDAIARALESVPLPPAPDATSAAPPAFDQPLDVRQPAALSNDALGLGGRNVFLAGLPGARPSADAASPEAAPPNTAPGIEQSLRDAMHERDHDAGLDVAGPVIAVAEEVTRTSKAPLDSRAVFEVTADGDGHVTGVTLVDVSQGRAEWERVATSLRDALRPRTLHVPGGSGGAVMTVEVTSRWQLPSGHDPDTEVTVLGLPVKKASKESKRPVKVEVLKPGLAVVQTPAQPGAPTGVKLPGYQLQVDLLNLDLDPTDLAPRPLRVVHARVLREKLL